MLSIFNKASSLAPIVPDHIEQTKMQPKAQTRHSKKGRTTAYESNDDAQISMRLAWLRRDVLEQQQGVEAKEVVGVRTHSRRAQTAAELPKVTRHSRASATTTTVGNSQNQSDVQTPVNAGGKRLGKQALRVVLKKSEAGVDGSEEMCNAEIHMNRRLQRTAPGACAEFLGTVNVPILKRDASRQRELG